jgi:hypothetical protein
VVTAPPWVSSIQRESPTDATVTVHRSTITNVAVVPEVSPRQNQIRLELVNKLRITYQFLFLGSVFHPQ